MAVWIIGGAQSASSIPVSSGAEEAGRTIGTGIGVTLLFLLGFIGFIVLSIIWFMTRPRNNVVVYGPNGQQVMVSEKEAKRRVEKQGWSYQPRSQPPPTAPLRGEPQQ